MMLNARRRPRKERLTFLRNGRERSSWPPEEVKSATGRPIGSVPYFLWMRCRHSAVAFSFTQGSVFDPLRTFPRCVELVTLGPQRSQAFEAVRVPHPLAGAEMGLQLCSQM